MSTCTKMFNYLIKLLVIFTACVFLSHGKISDKRRCFDEECSVPISEARTLLSYGSGGSGLLSFKANDKVIIFSKSAGSREDLWGAEINGKRGYVPKLHVRESKILQTDLKFVVDTEKKFSPLVPVESIPKADKVKQPYEIHEGTKIFTNEVDNPLESPDGGTENNQETPPLEVEPQAIKNEEKAEEVTNTNIVSKVLGEIRSWMDDDKEEKEVDFIEVDDEDDDDEAEIEESENSGGVTIQQNESKSEEGVTVKPEESSTANKEIQIDDKKEETVTQLEESVEKINETSNEEVLIQEDSSKPLIQNLDISQIKHLPPPLFKLPMNEVPVQPIIENVLASTNPSQEVPVSDDSSTSKNSDDKETAGTLTQDALVLSEHNSTQSGSETTEKLVENVSETGEGSKTIVQIEDLSPVQEVAAESEHSENNSTQDLTDASGGSNGDKLVQNLLENLDEQGIKFDQVSVLPPEGVISENNATEEVPIETDSSNLENMQKNAEVVPPSTELPLEEVASPSTELPLEEVPSPSTELPLEEVPSPSTELPLKEVPSPTIEVPLEEVSPPSIELPLEEVSPPSIEVPLEEVSPPSVELPLEEVVTKPTENLLLTEEASNILSEGGLDDSEKENINDPSVSVTEQPSINYENSFNTSENLTSESEDVEAIKETVTENVHQSSLSESTVDNSDNLVAKEDNGSSSQNISLNLPDDLVEEAVPIEENVPQVENDVANARDILWGSTVRKEILEKQENHQHTHDPLISKQTQDEFSCAANPSHSDCLIPQESFKNDNSIAEELDFSNIDIFFVNEVIVVVLITAVAIVLFLWGYMLIEKSWKQAPLIAKINNLEKVYLVMQKENEILTEKLENVETTSNEISDSYLNDSIDDLKQELAEIVQIVNLKEEQIQNLEKELSNSTEVGLELNRMLSEFLSSENGSTIVANVEQLQRQLIEQQDVINTSNDSLAIRETENHELRLELEINNTKVVDLQSELNKMALNLLKIEEDKEQIQSTYSSEALELKNKLTEALAEVKNLKLQYDNAERELEVKSNEYILLRDSISTSGKGISNGETVNNLVDMSSIKAELLQLRKEKQILTEKLVQEVGAKSSFEEQAELANREVQSLKVKYDTADREKYQAETKLEVLSNYFKEREAQLQKDLSKQESLWMEKEGEATSTIERIKYMQDELQNYKTQYESLKQEILSQEVDMKSQISVLEKRAHENWVSARQAERKLEDAKQEAAQLRNRLTLRERSFNDEKNLNQQNGDTQISPIPSDGINNNSLMYNPRDHITTSPPPLSGGLPPFMPPPPSGVSFMPPPLGGVPMPPPGLLPPPPSMMPGDHRPPPLGRMSSPPVNSRYSPDSRYSPFRRNSPSPTSEDDYDRSSPHLYRGGYNPYNRDDERRDFNRPPPKRNNVRHNKGAPYSSGSANSNESLEKLNRHNSKV